MTNDIQNKTPATISRTFCGLFTSSYTEDDTLSVANNTDAAQNISMPITTYHGQKNLAVSPFRIQRRTISFEYKTTHIFPEWQRVCSLRCNFCLGHLNGKNYGQGATHCWQNRAKNSVCQTPRAFLEYLLGEIGTNECVDDIRGSTQGQKPSPVVQRRNVTDDDI
jgi:hypothetical protein